MIVAGDTSIIHYTHCDWRVQAVCMNRRSVFVCILLCVCCRVMALVGQEPVLFARTVKENIEYGMDEADHVTMDE